MTNHPAADKEMREQFDALTFDKETRALQPRCITKDLYKRIDPAPATRWDVDIMTHAGEQHFRNLVAHVKVMCAGL